MATATTYRMTPDELYLSKAMKAGTAKLAELSMRELKKPDASLQCRVQHIDVEHVRRLSLIHDETGSIAPIVVFQDPKSGKRWVADGFHRHRMLEIKKAPSIWAYVLKGDKSEALAYSTMCNRQLCLPRTREDIKKAVMMLMKEDVWLRKEASEIARHVGCATDTVMKYRLQYCADHDIDPVTVDRRYDPTYEPRRRRRGPKPVFKPDLLAEPQVFEEPEPYKFKGKMYQPPNLAKSIHEVKADAIEEYLDDSVSPRSGKSIAAELTKNGLSVRSFSEESGEKYEGLWGLVVHNTILVTWVEYEPLRPHDLPAAFGRLLLMNRVLGLDTFKRLVILCEPGDGDSKILRLITSTRVEVTSLKGFISRGKTFGWNRPMPP